MNVQEILEFRTKLRDGAVKELIDLLNERTRLNEPVKTFRVTFLLYYIDNLTANIKAGS